MKYQTLFTMGIAAVSLAGCSNSTTNMNPGTMPPLGIHGTVLTNDWDKLNTLVGYYIQDADIPSNRDSIGISFTADEQSRIERVADAVGFWAIPADVPVVQGLFVEPNPGTTTIRIKNDAKDWSISWNGVPQSGFTDQIATLRDTIYSILHARPEVQGMPPPVLRD